MTAHDPDPLPFSPCPCRSCLVAFLTRWRGRRHELRGRAADLAEQGRYASAAMALHARRFLRFQARLAIRRFRQAVAA